MALTKLEKAQNAAAKKVKDRAHNERVKIYRSLMADIDKMSHIKVLKNEADKSDALFDKVIRERNKKQDELRAKILELEKQIADLYSQRHIEAEREYRKDSFAKYLEAKRIEEQLIKNSFPDLSDSALFSSAAWVPPQEVLDQMEEARRTAQAKD